MKMKARRVFGAYKGMFMQVSEARKTEYLADHLAFCSCPSCCNRRLIEGAPQHELRADISFREQVEEL